MQLEWRALGRAVESSGSERAEGIADALAFRRERHRLFPGAADNERCDEIREGLASYTGIAAWANSPADARRAAAVAAAGGELQQSFVGNFEAASGPAYGVLLDELLPGWRREVRATSDLGGMLAAATDRPATTDGPVLTMPGRGSGTSNTMGSVGIPGAGTVFSGNFTLSAKWGRLDANGGVLRSADGATLAVPVTEALEGATLHGDGWNATLNSGWVVRPAARPGSFAIVREN